MPLGTPYITPQMLRDAPSGVSWDIIPEPNSTDAETLAELTNVCWRATSKIDTYCNQPLRSTVNTEYVNGPGMPRCNVDPDTGNGVLQMKRWPITEVLAILISPSRAFPRAWTPVPAGNWDIRHPLIWSGDSASATAPDGGWTIDVAPGYISWCGTSPGLSSRWSGGGGRGGQRVQVCDINGWPHTSLTATAAAGATTISVDDVTGWTGALGFVYDGAATEQVSGVSVSATSALVLPNGAGTAQAGAGTITLSSPLAYEHQKGTVISALPAVVIEASVYAASVQALEAGIDSVAIQTLSGEHLSSSSSMKEIATEYELLLDPFRRHI